MEYHYVYSITYTDEPNIYYGVRTSKRSPEKDVYWGSPITFKEFMNAHKATRIKTILATYQTREEAELAEDALILKQWGENKLLSLNAGINGTKFNALGRKPSQKQIEAGRKANIGRKRTPEQIQAVINAQTGRKRTPEQIEAVVKACEKKFFIVSPTGQIFQGVNLVKFCESANLCHSACVEVLKGRKLHYRGWTASLAAHKLYIEAYDMRGVCRDKRYKNSWHVNWVKESKRKVTFFKSKSDAIAFRDSLEANGYKFMVMVPGWKDKLKEKLAA